MDLRRLEIFAKVAELGSFSRAAEALFLTQPTVSEHVRALEDELGVQLLDRLGRGAAPTRAGQLLLGYARRMLGLAREAQQALDQFQGRMSGELVIGGSTIPGEYVMPTLIGRFKGKYPDISVSLLIGDSRQVSEWVEEGRVEVALVGARPGSRALESRAASISSLTRTARARRSPRHSSTSWNPSRSSGRPKRHERARALGQGDPSHRLRLLRWLSVEDGSWRSPGGVERAAAAGDVGGDRAQPHGRSRRGRRRGRLPHQRRP